MSVIKATHRIDHMMASDGVLHVGAPNVGDRAYFNRMVDQIFQRRWFTNGGCLVKELEAKLREFLGVKHCIVVCNATVGLQLAFHALELTGEVILPSFTFVATPHAAQWERLTPVFADVRPHDHTICPRSIESLITDRTSAIVGVHLWGNLCDVDAIANLAERYQLSVVYDAAHAFACGNRTHMVGSFGNCEVFSFHATKFFNTFEGGAIATNDDALAERISLMKNFGFAGMDHVVHLGTNAKMPEICAAMGLSVLSCIDELIDKNRYNHQLYLAHLQGRKGLRVMEFDRTVRTNYQYIVIEIDEREFGSSRDEVVRRLADQSIRARRYFYPGCHRMEPYASMPHCQNLKLPHTESLCDRVICLPTGSTIDESDIDRVCRIVRGD